MLDNSKVFNRFTKKKESLYDKFSNRIEVLTSKLDINEGMSLEWSFLNSSRHGDIRGLDDLLKQGVDINTKDNDGNNALQVALLFNQLKVIEYLVSKGLDVDSVDSNGRSLLINAVLNRKIDIVKGLLKLRADKYKKDNNNMNSVDYARDYGFYVIAELLE